MRSWLPVKNAVEMLLNVLFHGRNGEVYNIANVEENAISILDLAKEICRLTDVPLEEKNQNSIVDKSAPQTMNLSISKYEKEFGICEFEKISDVLKDVVDWYREISKKGNN
jgi:nucleoside-diphosphate-sugar epimerase